MLEDRVYRWLKLYRAAPAALRKPLGELYRRLPARLRHGARFEHFRAEANLRDPAQVARLAQARLRETLLWAASTVPAYRHLHGPRLARIAVDELLALFPLTSKAGYRAMPHAYLSAACRPSQRLPMQTSGSVAEPFAFVLEKGVSRAREAAYIEAFGARIGLRRDDVVLSLRGGEGAVAVKRGGPLHRYEPINRRLCISPNHLDAQSMVSHVEAALAHGVSFVQGYGSAVYELARWLELNPCPRFTAAIRGVQLFSECADEGMLALIERVFGCPVLVHYGHSERAVMAASMPDDPRYFVWPLYGHVELVDAAGEPIRTAGVPGEIVATGFDNRAMPLVRYRTGDVAMWSQGPSHPALPGFPVLERIDGRSNDFFVAKDGRHIPVASLGGLRPPVFLKVEATQYEQREPGRLLVRLQTSRPLAPAAFNAISDYFRAKLLGLVEAELQVVPHIPRTAYGKRRLMIQHLGGASFGQGVGA